MATLFFAACVKEESTKRKYYEEILPKIFGLATPFDCTEYFKMYGLDARIGQNELPYTVKHLKYKPRVGLDEFYAKMPLQFACLQDIEYVMEIHKSDGSIYPLMRVREYDKIETITTAEIEKIIQQYVKNGKIKMPPGWYLRQANDEFYECVLKPLYGSNLGRIINICTGGVNIPTVPEIQAKRKVIEELFGEKYRRENWNQYYGNLTLMGFPTIKILIAFEYEEDMLPVNAEFIVFTAKHKLFEYSVKYDISARNGKSQNADFYGNLSGKISFKLTYEDKRMLQQ